MIIEKSYDNKLATLALIFCVVALLFSSISSTLMVVFNASVAAFLFAYSFFKNIKQQGEITLILFLISLLVISISATFMQTFFFDNDSNFLQAFRNGTLWTLAGLYILFSKNIYLDRGNLPRIIKFLGYFFIFSFFFVLLEIFLSTVFNSELKLSPADIRTDGRIYAFGLVMTPVLLYIFLREKLYFACIAIIFLNLATSGKLNFALLGVAFFYFIIHLKATFFLKTLGIFLLSLLGIILGIIFIGDRLFDFFTIGDLRRLIQVIDAFTKLSESPLTSLFGTGIGTQYSEGYEIYNLSAVSYLESGRLIENSKYDLENGFIYFPLKFGLIGTVVLLYMFFKYLRSDGTMPYAFMLLSFISVSWSGPIHLFGFFSLALLTAYNRNS